MQNNDASQDANANRAVTDDVLREQVREGYSRIAQSGSWSSVVAAPNACCSPTAGGGCCGPATFTPAALAQAIGYSVGGKGFRVGTSANGRRYSAFSIPGTGVGYRGSGCLILLAAIPASLAFTHWIITSLS